MSELVYEPFDARFREHPEWHYAELRSRAPVYRSPKGYWVISRYDEIQSILRDPITYSNSIVGKEALSLGEIDPSIPLAEICAGMPVDPAQLMATAHLVASDPPKHTSLRRIVNKAFLPKRLGQWDEYIRAATTEFLSDVDSARPWNLVSTLAMPLPVSVICHILGGERQHRSDIKRWSDVIIHSAHGAQRGTREAQLQMLLMLRDFSNYFMPLIEARRRAPTEDLISDLVRAEENESLSNLESLMFLLNLMVAGNETTTNLIGNAVLSLLEHPEQLARLQAQPSLLSNAIEETLRHRSPVQFIIRSPAVDVELRGQLLRAGEPMCLLIASANRDPDKYPDPERFDVGRELSNSHVAFGQGIHSCLGLHLARREAHIALGALLGRLHEWRLSDRPLARVDSSLIYGFESIELVPRRVRA